MIVSINNLKVNELTDEEISELIFPETLINFDEDKIKEVKIEILRKNTNDTLAYQDHYKSHTIVANPLFDEVSESVSVLVKNFKQLCPLTNKFELSYILDYRWDN